MIKRILCPVDFSSTSAGALEYACRLAQSTGAELLVLHALERPAGSTAPGVGSAADREFHDWTEAALATAKTPVDPSRVQHVGPPGEVICWTAQDRESDLIVMGTHGRTGLRHLLFGSVAEHVLQHARCPVLTVRQRPDDEPPLEEPREIPPAAPKFM